MLVSSLGAMVRSQDIIPLFFCCDLIENCLIKKFFLDSTSSVNGGSNRAREITSY